MTVFNTATKLSQRSRAAAHPAAPDFDYLRDEVAARLVGRLRDITRAFPTALDLGSNSGNVLAQLLAQRREGEAGAGGVAELHAVDACAGMHARSAAAHAGGAARAGLALHTVAAPLEGAPLPFEDASMDLVLSSMALHWVNDVPGLLAEVRRVLRPDGAFLAAFLGGDTLQELRCAPLHPAQQRAMGALLRPAPPPTQPFTRATTTTTTTPCAPPRSLCSSAAEQERDGGVSPRVSPMMRVADAGNLLAGAGFGLPLVDADTFTIEYPSPAALFEHLRAMGGSNAALGARQGARRDTLLATAAAYTALYGDAEGRVPATFQVVYMIGWAPAATQPRAKARGSVPKGFQARAAKAPAAAPAAPAPAAAAQ